jgi:hypothetical protein
MRLRSLRLDDRRVDVIATSSRSLIERTSQSARQLVTGPCPASVPQLGILFINIFVLGEQSYRVIGLGHEWAVLGTGPGYHDGQCGGGFPELSISRKDGQMSRIALSK